MTTHEQAHCDQVWKCLIAKLAENGQSPAEWEAILGAYRGTIDKAVIISAKLALLTLEPPKPSPEDQKIIDMVLHRDRLPEYCPHPGTFRGETCSACGVDVR